MRRGGTDHPVDHPLYGAGDKVAIVLRAVADQALQGTVDDGLQARPVAVEEEDQDQAEDQFQDPSADLRAARQQPVADLADIGLEHVEERHALLVDGVPPADQAVADQRYAGHPRRRRRQALDLEILQQLHQRANVVRQAEAEPDQRQCHQDDPAQGQQARRQRLAATEQAREHAHQRPTGESQHRGPEQRRPEWRQHPETGTEQTEQQHAKQQPIVIEHQGRPSSKGIHR